MKKIVSFQIDGKFPSINNKYYKNFAITKEYRDFKNMVHGYSLVCVDKNRELEKNKKYSVYLHFKTYKDIDNLLKPLLDGMEKVVYENDKLVSEIHIKKEFIKKGESDSLFIEVFENDN